MIRKWQFPVTGDSGSEVLDHVCAAEPGFRLAAACVQGARRKQRLVYVSEQCLLWCPLRCEIPLFKYTIWYSFNTSPTWQLPLHRRYSNLRYLSNT
jgi:hypothetical protein